MAARLNFEQRRTLLQQNGALDYLKHKSHANPEHAGHHHNIAALSDGQKSLLFVSRARVYDGEAPGASKRTSYTSPPRRIWR
jgi:hypothetical protein